MDINFLKQNGVDVDKSLELFGDMEIYNATFQDYLDGIEEKKNNLSKAKENTDWATYAIYAHSIKSDARYLGFTNVASVVLNHEMAGKEGNQHFILKDYDNLINVTDNMTDIVKRYLAGERACKLKEEEEVEVNAEMVNQTPTILIADDSKLVGNFASKILSTKYRVVLAYDGEETLNIINSHKYNIKALLLDLNMPKMDGFEVLEYFKKNNLFEKVPVSIITGEDSKDMINKAFTYNIVDMLVKPFSNQDILRVVEKTIKY